MEDRKHFFFLNVGHFLDHLFMSIFATVAALALTKDWELGHFELIPYATPGLITFGVFALPAGWLADRVLKVTRKSPSAGVSIAYRLIVEGS